MLSIYYDNAGIIETQVGNIRIGYSTCNSVIADMFES